MSLIVAAKSSSNVIVGSETLEIAVDSSNPETEVSRNEDRKKIIKFLPDFAILFAGTFNGDQMNEFLNRLTGIVMSRESVELSEISDEASLLAKGVFTSLKPHHQVGFIFAGFNGEAPAIEIMGSEVGFAVAAPREQYFAGGHTDFALPYLAKNLHVDMSAKEIKEVVRKTINLAKKSNPELGGKTDVKTLYRPQPKN